MGEVEFVSLAPSCVRVTVAVLVRCVPLILRVPVAVT